MLDKVTAKNFKDIVGTEAAVTIMDGPDVPLTVEEVIVTKLSKDDDRPGDVRKQPFTVVLSGPESNQAEDGTYDVSFEKIGVLEGVYVDNKSDIPETEDFNKAEAEKVKKPAKKTKASKAKKAEAEEAAPGAAPPPEPEPKVLYEICFG